MTFDTGDHEYLYKRSNISSPRATKLAWLKPQMRQKCACENLFLVGECIIDP